MTVGITRAIRNKLAPVALLLLSPLVHAQDACEVREYTSSEQQVIDAYIAFYGRAPDRGGFEFWSNRLDEEGGNLSSIIQAFGVSDEFNDRFGSLDNEALVNNLFQQLFGRDADEGGLAFYVGELESGARTLQSIALDILNGAQNEDKTIVENRALVSGHYMNSAENRGTDLSGDTIFTVLEEVDEDPSAVDSACGQITQTFIEEVGNGVGKALATLGISTEETPRLDEGGEPLPEDYSPLGPQTQIGGVDEIYLAGLTERGSSVANTLLRYAPASGGIDASTTTLTESPLDDGWKSSPYNSATSGDVDGDGFAEIVQFWWDESTSMLMVSVIEDKSEAFIQSSSSQLMFAEPDRLKVAATDLDGDGSDEILVAVVDEATGAMRVTLLDGDSDSGYDMSDVVFEYETQEAFGNLSIEMKGARLDRDSGQELVVIVNETFGSGRNGSPGNGHSNYYIYDDLNAGLELLQTDRIAAEIDLEYYRGVTGDVAVGDFDRDNLDELVFTAMADGFPVECDSVDTVQVALDDLVQEFEVIATSFYRNRLNGCSVGGNNGWTSYIQADALDFDGDGVDEFHIMGVIFNDFFNDEPLSVRQYEFSSGRTEDMRVAGEWLLRGQTNNGRAQITQDNTVISVADIDGNGTEDLLVYAPMSIGVEYVCDGNSCYWRDGRGISAWQVDSADNTRDYEPFFIQELESPHQDEDDFGAPVVLGLNVDDDATVLKFAGEHRQIFTEPIVLAVLAAPPCWDEGIQVTDVCQTSWGSGSLVAGNSSYGHQVTARGYVTTDLTVDLPFVGDVGVEITKSVSTSLGYEVSLGYETIRTITYTTGAMEDTVVATVIPYDQYTYTVMSHPTYPDMVGEEMQVTIPRSPRTIQIERRFFNEAVAGTGVNIGNEVFKHSIGNPDSYPTRSEMEDTISAIGRKVGPVDVGASNGNTSVEISDELVSGFTASMSIGYETEVKTDGGVPEIGFAVGEESTAALGFTVGSTVVFTGVVGDMPPETFSLDKGYSYGLFAYTQRARNGQRFQVVNYWVE